MKERFGRINMWRRVVQGVLFAFLVYGAYLFPGRLESEALPAVKPPPGQPSTTRFTKDKVLWATDDKPVLESYPPGAICRFNPKGGFFKACVLHFLSENLTWQTHIKHFLPHLAFFGILAFVFARLWCGWACPLGAVGDFMCWVRKKLGFDYVRFSRRTQRILRIGSWTILGLALGISLFAAFPPAEACKDQLFLPYCQICPARLVFPLFGGKVQNFYDFSTLIYTVFSVLSWVLLALFVLAFVTGKNLWCRLCPIGAFPGFFNRGGGTALIKTMPKCNGCGTCADACPVASTRVYDARKTGDVSNSECILCLRCVELCPRDGALEFRLLGKTVARSSFNRGSGESNMRSGGGRQS